MVRIILTKSLSEENLEKIKEEAKIALNSISQNEFSYLGQLCDHPSLHLNLDLIYITSCISLAVILAIGIMICISESQCL